MKPGIRQHGPATLKLRHSEAVPARMRTGVLELHNLLTPEEHRGHGFAGQLMLKVCSEADEARMVLLLMPKPFDTPGMDQSQLAEWYARCGFEPIQANPLVMARRPGAVSFKVKPLKFAMGAL